MFPKLVGNAVVLLALGMGMFFLSRATIFSDPDFEAGLPSDTPPAHPSTPIVPSLDSADPDLRALAEDNAKLPFRGQLGDFLVTPGEADNNILCGEARAKELSSRPVDIFGAEGVSPGPCGVIAGDSTIELRRYYFLGTLHVPFEAPRDRLKLMTIAGRPALVEMPPIPMLPIRLIVIERFPDEEPGAFTELRILPSAVGGLDRGVEVVEQLLQ